MSSRELNRRNLGKTIVALAMLAAVQPLKPLIVAEETQARKRTQLPDAASGQKLPFLCICRRMDEGDLVTFLKRGEANGEVSI